MKKRNDWDEIKADYMSGGLSIEQLSAKYKVNPSTIWRHSSSENWEADRNEVAIRMHEIAKEGWATDGAKRLEKVGLAAQQILDKAVEAIGYAEIGEKGTSRELRDLIAVVKDAQSILRSVYNIPTLAEQAVIDRGIATIAIERERLEMDKKKLDADSGTDDIHVVMEAGEESWDA